MLARILLFLAAMAVPAAALGQTEAESARLEQRADDIVAAMRGEAVYDEVFAEVFVSAVPQAQFDAIKNQVESQFGALIGVDTVEPRDASSAAITIRFERGLASGGFQLQPAEPYAITGFRISDIRPIDDSLENVEADLAALPGEAGMLVAPLADGATPLVAVNANRQLAIGSTFKLYVLSALARAVAAGEHDWDEVVPLSVRSYPGGQLQDWPQGAPVTLHTLATLMISISDNTATDQLMAILGRETVEAEVAASGHADPAATFPLLTTRELFLLKSGDEADLATYSASNVSDRRTMLEGLGAIDRSDAEVIAAFADGPNAIDIEWLASPTDLAGILRRIAELDDSTAREIMAVNGAMVPNLREGWQYVGYKGGSEPGVLNLTWLLQDAGGPWHVATLSWNDPDGPVDQQAFELLAMRAIALAAEP